MLCSGGGDPDGSLQYDEVVVYDADAIQPSYLACTNNPNRLAVTYVSLPPVLCRDHRWRKMD